MRKQLLLKLAATTAALAMSAISAQAASLEITSISGVWTSANPAGVSGVGTDTISWGNPVSDGGSQSSYSFASAGVPISANSGDSFSLGDFTHNNYAITGNALTDAVLQLTFGFDIGTNSYSLTNSYNFAHWETTNSNPCPVGSYQSVCDDRVTATLNAATAETILLDGTTYTFNVDGFTVGGSLFSEFWTGEGAANMAALTGSFSAYTPPPVPLPAAGFLLLGGMGSLAALRRRKKAS